MWHFKRKPAGHVVSHEHHEDFTTRLCHAQAYTASLVVHTRVSREYPVSPSSAASVDVVEGVQGLGFHDPLEKRNGVEEPVV